MAILGNKNTFFDDIDEKEDNYTLPATSRHDEDGISFKKSLILSTILHPTVIGLIWLIVFALALMGITFSLFEKPKPKNNDIEFVLVNHEQTPLNKHTRFRSDMNSRTGGHRNPKKRVSMPSPNSTKRSVKAAATPTRKASVTPHKSVAKHTAQPVHKNIFQKVFAPTPQPKPKATSHKSGSSASRPHPPSVRPSLAPPSIPRLSPRPHSNFAIPVPRPTGAPTGRSYSTGPIGGHGHATSGSGGRSSHYGSSGGGGYSAPTPSLSPTRGGGGSSSGSRGSRYSSHGSSGYGNAGNPGGGGGRPGIDSIREPDFGPYMRELQRRIKMNWEPPKGNESKRVVLLFKIARDGRLLSISTYKSSGLPRADKAAVNAVELTAPFRPLPANFRGNSIAIQFTFDYNVFGATGY